jgi:putative transposase
MRGISMAKCESLKYKVCVVHLPQVPSLNSVGRASVEPTNPDGGRRNPAPGVNIYPGSPTIAFLTVCTLKRQKGLANAKVHKALVEAWTAADQWLVGHYVIMPDHIHLFCAPQTDDYSIEQWITYWKRQFRRYCKSAPKFQPRGFHHRLRRSDIYSEELDYMLNNPVRAGLVKTAEEWRFRGVLRILAWWQER